MTPQEENQLNRREIEEAREILKSLQKDGFYSIPKVTWWILHYEELFKYSYENRHNGSCIDGMGCSCSWNAPKCLFSGIYIAILEVIQLHQYEDYFKKELAVLENVREDYPGLMQWLKKNEKLGAEDFILFWIEWFDEEQEVVNTHIGKESNLGIKFKPEEWKYTIEFLKEFNEIYWTSDACPDVIPDIFFTKSNFK